jgi:hypothetical protein
VRQQPPKNSDQQPQQQATHKYRQTKHAQEAQATADTARNEERITTSRLLAFEAP